MQNQPAKALYRQALRNLKGRQPKRNSRPGRVGSAAKSQPARGFAAK